MLNNCLTLLWCVCLVYTSSDTYEQYILDTMDEICPYTDMCFREARNTIGNAFNVPCCNNCSCNHDCLLFDTCCPDSPVLIDNANINIDISDQDQYFKGTCISTAFTTGAISTGNTEIPLGIQHVYAIHYCSKAYEHSHSLIERLCVSDDPTYMKQLQFVSDDKGYIFKNEFCAKCNGVTNYTVWEMSIACNRARSTGQDISIEYIKQYGCYVWSTPPSIDLIQRRICQKIEIDKCNSSYTGNKTSVFIEKACAESHFVSFVANSKVYKNIFCFLCNSEEEPSKICIPSLGSKFGKVSFIAVIGGLSNSKTVNMDQRCSIEEVYDLFEEKCRELKCPPFTYPVNGRCLDTFIRADGVIFGITLRLDLNTEVPVQGTVFIDNLLDHISEIFDVQIGCPVCSIGIVKEQTLTFMVRVVAQTKDDCSLMFIRNLGDIVRDFNVEVRLNETIVQGNIEMTSKIPEYIEEYRFKKSCRDVEINITEHSGCPRFIMTGHEFRTVYTRHGLDLQPINNKMIDFLNNQHTNDRQALSLDICVDDYFGMLSESLSDSPNTNSSVYLIYLTFSFIHFSST